METLGDIAGVIAAGAGDRVVISHDSVWCWKGNPFPPKFRANAAKMVPTLIDEQIIPKLLDAGVTEAGTPFLVMQYVDGCAVDTYCDRHRLAVLATGPDSIGEGHIVTEHAYLPKCFRTVSD